MTDKDIKYNAYEKLLQRRRDILRNVSGLDEISRTFDNPGAEFETRAQYETGYQNLRQLDKRARQEIQRIDRALAKLEQGGFGSCEACGRSIEPKRLQAVPWTEYCLSCAASEEGEAAEPAAQEERSLPLAGDVNPAELTDEELEELVHDKLHEDARLETIDLQVTCEDGMVHLSGTLPDETQYRILFDALEEMLNLKDIVDEIRILPSGQEESLPDDIEASDPADDERLWHREDRE